MTPTLIVAYLVIFATVGFLFIFALLLIGWFLRARAPTPEKQEIYECGEPAVGSGFVQFDLRFYVVALVFIIFDVEVAFFFPWATVFGKATQLVDLNQRIEATANSGEGSAEKLIQAAAAKQTELGVKNPPTYSNLAEDAERGRIGARRLALTALADISVFFAVLLVGYAYVWYRGDLNWVRAMSPEQVAVGEEVDQETAVV
jgi:NADH-quinone oxidoreductase subunit A